MHLDLLPEEETDKVWTRNMDKKKKNDRNETTALLMCTWRRMGRIRWTDKIIDEEKLSVAQKNQSSQNSSGKEDNDKLRVLFIKKSNKRFIQMGCYKSTSNRSSNSTPETML